MPKLLTNARNEILASASLQLREKGYQGLAIREVAAQCGMASGTVYNYFPSKLDLVSHIMLIDWLRYLERLDEALQDAPDCETVLSLMFDMLSGFCEQYRAIWADSRQSPEAMTIMSHRSADRERLHQQLAQRLCQTFSRLGRDDLTEGFVPSFLVRNLLQYATEADVDYRILSPVLSRILKGEPSHDRSICIRHCSPT